MRSPGLNNHRYDFFLEKCAVCRRQEKYLKMIIYDSMSLLKSGPNLRFYHLSRSPSILHRLAPPRSQIPSHSIRKRTFLLRSRTYKRLGLPPNHLPLGRDVSGGVRVSKQPRSVFWHLGVHTYSHRGGDLGFLASREVASNRRKSKS